MSYSTACVICLASQDRIEWECQDKAISSSGHVTACAVPLPLFN